MRRSKLRSQKERTNKGVDKFAPMQSGIEESSSPSPNPFLALWVHQIQRASFLLFFWGGGVDLNPEHKLKASQNSGIWTCAVSLNPYELKKPIIHIRVKESM